MENKALIREVNELKVYCIHHGEGWMWVGMLQGLKNHLVSDIGCGYAWVPCNNHECEEIMKRMYLQTHLQEKCQYRPYTCEYCGHEDTYIGITAVEEGHYSECLEYPLDCPNRCGVTGIRRRAMPDHHSSCPLEPLNCLFKDAGCTEKIARKDMEDHMTANQQKHILLTFQSHQQMKWNISREINNLEESIRDDTLTSESTAKSLRRMKSILKLSLDDTDDELTFHVTDFSQLRKEKKSWQSPPFSIGGEMRLRVALAVHPSGIGKGQGSHVSVSLILKEDFTECMTIEFNMSVAALDSDSDEEASITMEVCTSRQGDDAGCNDCTAYFPLPSPGEVLRPEEQFLETEKATDILMNDSLILEIKVEEHEHNTEDYDTD